MEKEEIKEIKADEVTEGKIANQLLSFVQNIDSEEDAFEFARIFIDAMEKANETTYDKTIIMQDVSDIDKRFVEKFIEEIKAEVRRTEDYRPWEDEFDRRWAEDKDACLEWMREKTKK